MHFLLFVSVIKNFNEASPLLEDVKYSRIKQLIYSTDWVFIRKKNKSLLFTSYFEIFGELCEHVIILVFRNQLVRQRNYEIRKDKILFIYLY